MPKRVDGLSHLYQRGSPGHATNHPSPDWMLGFLLPYHSFIPICDAIAGLRAKQKLRCLFGVELNCRARAIL
jgi:hypothetical protein